MWVRECRQGGSDNYYIESGGMYIDCKADPNELDTGANVDISELNSLRSTYDYVINESYNVQSQSNCFGHSYDYFNKLNVDVS
ncbi:unnamed protein product [Rotaria sordida]|uniref:Uncharacterized protein n=1 Tax=Rotaria sordida TaxID=392033 RepID=A0A813TUW5_9BILA|nr:unnamed protein product [Rotaria sordida]CAF0816633.1 unnamed protein product [Rotaria sordida]